MSQHPTTRRLRWSLLAVVASGAMLLSGCTGSSDGDSGSGEAAQQFTFMFPMASDVDDYYIEFAEKYMEETGVEIELLDYPSDAFDNQVRTQLQAGNAADLIILSPGTGQPRSVVDLADSGFLAPLDETSASTIPAGTEDLYSVDGEVYGQPTGLLPVALVYNPATAAEVGITEFPETFDDMLAACADVRDAGKAFLALAGSVPINPGLLTQGIAATRVYESDPDWNAQRAAGEVTFADSGWKDVLEDFVAMNDGGCFQDGAAGAGFDAITNGMVGGGSLTAAVPGNAANSMNSAAEGLEIDVRAFPPAAGQEPWILSSANYAWGINAAAEEGAQLAAQEFLDWLAEPEVDAEFAANAGLLPMSGGDDVLPIYAAVADLISGGSTSPLPNATWPNAAVYDELSVGAQGLLTGQTTVDGVLEAMDAAWDQ